MADYSLRDLWWLQPKGPDNPLPALQLGVNIAQNKAAMDLKERDLANDIARTSLMREEMMYKQNIQTQITAGNTAIARTMSEINDWADPEQVAKVWATVEQYPLTADSKAVLGARYMHDSAVRAKIKQEELTRKSELAKNVGWVYPEDGSPPYLMDARGGVKLAPFHAGLDSGFTPQETDIGGVHMVQTSPNRWQVVERPLPQGKLTDLEREDLRFVRKQRQEIVDSLPESAPKPGLFSNKDAIAAYTAKTNKIAELTAREDAIRNAVQSRNSAPPAPVQRSSEVAPPPATPQTAPAPVAPPEQPTVKQGGNLFQQQPDGSWKWVGQAP